MDNTNCHTRKKIEELIKFVRASIGFLPTYSPNLNPIEHHWFRIKIIFVKLPIILQIFLTQSLMDCQ